MSELACYNCGKPATTIVQDISGGRVLLTILLCRKCNTRRKAVEAIPTSKASEDDNAFMWKITHEGRSK